MVVLIMVACNMFGHSTSTITSLIVSLIDLKPEHSWYTIHSSKNDNIPTFELNQI